MLLLFNLPSATENVTLPDKFLWILGTVITALLGTNGWMVRKLIRTPRHATVENGKRVSIQDYIVALENHAKTNAEIMQDVGPRLATVETSARLMAINYAKLKEVNEDAVRTLNDIIQRQTLQMDEARRNHQEKIERIEDEVSIIAEDLKNQRALTKSISTVQKSFGDTLRTIAGNLERMELMMRKTN